jgi:hypothetical protein
MSREFTAHVVVRNPEDFQIITFAPGDEVPEWALNVVGDHVTQGVTQARQTSEESPADDDTTVTNEDGTETTAVTPEYEADDEEDEEDVPYTEWSKDDLKAEAKSRELTGLSKATVDELIEALEADDAAEEE